MTSQIRRSAASIAANIAEGHGRENTGSFIQSLRVAQGSLKELETHLILSEQVGLLGERLLTPLLEQTTEIGKMLRSMIRKLQQIMTVDFSPPRYSLLALRYSLFAIRYSLFAGTEGALRG